MKKNVEKYLNNNLSMTEETAFEEKNIKEGFDFIERRATWNNVIADTFAEIEAETAPKVKIRRLWQYAAAASVALLVVSVWAIQTLTPQHIDIPSTPLIADASMDLEKLLSNDVQPIEVRKGNDNLDNWQSDFQSAQYSNVIQSLEKVGNKRTMEQSYYLAQAYLKSNPINTAKAQPLLKTVSEANSDYAQDALWSYALICVKHKHNEAAKIALDKVIKESPIYANKARLFRASLK